MIEWLLKQIEKDPTTLFRKRDLLDNSPAEFERLKQRGLLVYVQTDPENETYPCNLPCARACPKQIVEMQGRFYAMCPEDSEIDPILLGEDDLHKYAFSMQKFLEEIRKANGLSSPVTQIEPDFSYVGYTVCDGRRVGFAFNPSLKEKGLLELCGLRKTCIDDDVLVLFSPVSVIDDISVRAELNRETIILAPLAIALDFGTFKVPVAKLAAEAIQAERTYRRMPQTRVPGDELMTFTEAAGLLGVNKGTVSRYADAGTILDNGQQGKERRVWKSSVLLWKQREEDEQVLRDARDLKNDARNVSDKH